MKTKLIFVPLTDYYNSQRVWVSISHAETIKYFEDGAIISFVSGESIMVKEKNVIERIREYSNEEKHVATT